MRLVSGESGIPPFVNRYLLPDERVIVVAKQHPGLLVPPLSTATGGLLAAITASVIAGGTEIAKLVVWSLTALLILRLMLAVYGWSVQVMVLTSRRFILISGISNRRVAYTQLPDLKKTTFERSFAGRVLGYGTYKIGPDGARQLVIDYVPFSEQIILELHGLAYLDRNGSEDD
jgi:Bacterial PH domain